MNAVKFGNYHSFRDLGVVLSSKTIGQAQVKTNIIEVPGADGSLDLTEYFGETKYKNRTLNFSFSMVGNMAYQLNQYSYIKNLLHGQRMRITLDADSGFYYVGRLSVGDLSNKKNICTFSITCDCEPYKYKLYKTIITNTVENSATLHFINSRKSVVPKITVTSPAQITFDGFVYNLDTGTYTIDDIVFKDGTNVVNVNGSTTITVEYQEGSL